MWGGGAGATVMVREGCPLAGGCGLGWGASLLNSSRSKAVGLQQPDLRVQTIVGSQPSPLLSGGSWHLSACI